MKRIYSHCAAFVVVLAMAAATLPARASSPPPAWAPPIGAELPIGAPAPPPVGPAPAELGPVAEGIISLGSEVAIVIGRPLVTPAGRGIEIAPRRPFGPVVPLFPR